MAKPPPMYSIDTVFGEGRLVLLVGVFVCVGLVLPGEEDGEGVFVCVGLVLPGEEDGEGVFVCVGLVLPGEVDGEGV
jgi:hypothetical protein